jgi:hypothetical protein|tara:strand:- start:115 stop:558 length:444 start_codon:yes stop_codon:yes gene_type:complete
MPQVIDNQTGQVTEMPYEPNQLMQFLESPEGVAVLNSLAQGTATLMAVDPSTGQVSPAGPEYLMSILQQAGGGSPPPPAGAMDPGMLAATQGPMPSPTPPQTMGPASSGVPQGMSPEQFTAAGQQSGVMPGQTPTAVQANARGMYGG